MAESPGLRVEIALALQPLLSALQGSELVALLTGKESLYEQMHQPAPARFSASGLPLYLAPPIRTGHAMRICVFEAAFKTRSARTWKLEALG